MSFDPEVRAALLATFARQQAKGYIKRIDPENPDLPISVLYPDLVPMRGNVHRLLGRVMTRDEINKQFAK